MGGDYLISKYDFIFIVCKLLELDSNLISPVEQEGGEDLIVPTSGNSFNHTLSEGLSYINKEYLLKLHKECLAMWSGG